jgi:hypothetical protein
MIGDHQVLEEVAARRDADRCGADATGADHEYAHEGSAAFR